MEVQVAATASTRASWPYLQYVLKGIKRTAGRSPSSATASWRGDLSYLHLLLWTVACVAFFGFTCMGEATAVPGTPPSITADGVAVDSHSAPSIIRLTLTRSKTDQFGRGSHTFLGKTGSNLCPVEALLQFLARRPGPRVGSLFIHEDGRPLTRDQFVSHLKEPPAAVGLTVGGTLGTVSGLEPPRQQPKQVSPTTSLKPWADGIRKPINPTFKLLPQLLQQFPQSYLMVNTLNRPPSLLTISLSFPLSSTFAKLTYCLLLFFRRDSFSHQSSISRFLWSRDHPLR